jgi:hypothetical protein
MAKEEIVACLPASERECVRERIQWMEANGYTGIGLWVSDDDEPEPDDLGGVYNGRFKFLVSDARWWASWYRE